MENERQACSPSASSFSPAAGQPVGLGLGLDQASVSVSQSYSSAPSPAEYQYNNPEFLPTQPQVQQQQQQQPSYVQSPFIKPDPGCGDPDSMEFVQQSQAFMAPEYGGPDFSLFQSSPGHGDAQFDQPIFESESLSPSNLGANMSSPQAHQSPTPPHHLGGGGSRHNSASPSFSQQQQQQYIHQNGGGHSHSRNASASLGPEAALMQNHITDWNRPQFQSHRRSLSEFSDVSSAVPSPHLGTHDSFDDAGHSPLQQATDPGMVMGIGNFSLSDPTPSMVPASPSRSPAPSPRMLPQSMSDANAPNLFGLGVSNGYGASQSYPSVAATGSAESFPQLQPPPGSETPQMAPPAINIDFAPSSTRQNTFEPSKSLDQDSLTPPDRGRPLSRRRAVTDPSNRGASVQGQLSPLMSPDMSGPSAAGSSRSLSPLDRDEATYSTRRRQSTSSVPNNIIALRLADPEYQATQDTGGITKRAQKHPATFQCTLCPKRFTRAYNLRSHLRTHTDERPFVCTVCAKAFARQHDRKRHESLHSGEKKFICKGELKDGGSWGCGRRFARADALGRHFRSESGRACIASLLREETEERQRYWHEQRLQNMGHNLGPPVPLDAPAYPMDPNFVLPAALLAQYPALAQMNWSASGLDDESKSSFDAASDYEDGEDTGYVSGPGAFGSGEQSFSEMGYASDYSAR